MPILQSYYGGPHEIGPTVDTKTYIFRFFCQHYLVLFTIVPRNRRDTSVVATEPRHRDTINIIHRPRRDTSAVVTEPRHERFYHGGP